MRNLGRNTGAPKFKHPPHIQVFQDFDTRGRDGGRNIIILQSFTKSNFSYEVDYVHCPISLYFFLDMLPTYFNPTIKIDSECNSVKENRVLSSTKSALEISRLRVRQSFTMRTRKNSAENDTTLLDRTNPLPSLSFSQSPLPAVPSPLQTVQAP